MDIEAMILAETERLYFRHFTIADAELLFNMHQHEEVTRYTGDTIPWSSVEAVQMILRELIMPQYELGIGRWAVHRKIDDAFIGWCGLKKISEGYDLGYRFLPHYWGMGYATEASGALLNIAMDKGFSPIIGRCAKANTASWRVLEKIGFTNPTFYNENGVPSVKMML